MTIAEGFPFDRETTQFPLRFNSALELTASWKLRIVALCGVDQYREMKQCLSKRQISTTSEAT
ncbi:hypothetical protein, partial [Henriciella sp.]|uniref:hypothetical protein n=1 Tax=Henriciella sp. TaxID=1968823 RepID=UPI0025BF904B